MLTVPKGPLVVPLMVAVAGVLPAHADAQEPGGIFWPNFFVGVDLADRERPQPRYFAEIHLKVYLAGQHQVDEIRDLIGSQDQPGFRQLLRTRLTENQTANVATRAMVDSFKIRPDRGVREPTGIFWPNLTLGVDLTRGDEPAPLPGGAPRWFAEIHLRVYLDSREQAMNVDNLYRRQQQDELRDLLLEQLSIYGTFNEGTEAIVRAFMIRPSSP